MDSIVKITSEMTSILLIFLDSKDSKGFHRILRETGLMYLRGETDSIFFLFPFFKIVVNSMLA